MRRVFVFRPEPGASDTLERGRALGLEMDAIPLFELEPVEWHLPDDEQFDGILLTSANAVNMAGDRIEHLRGLPVHAVGPSTAVAAEVAGFGLASVGRRGVDDLLGAIEPGARLLHLCGEDRRMPDRTEQPITPVIVYRSRPVASPGGLERLDGQVALVHSPRAAARLAELVGGKARAGIRIAAISEAAADAAGSGWDEVCVASEPADSALLALAARLCET